MKKAVIFDLDGTLIDSELFYLKLLLEFLKGKGMVLPFEEACKTVGAHNSPVWENVAGRTAEAYREKRFVRSIKTNLRESSGIGSWITVRCSLRTCFRYWKSCVRMA